MEYDEEHSTFLFKVVSWQADYSDYYNRPTYFVVIVFRLIKVYTKCMTILENIHQIKNLRVKQEQK